MTSRTFRTALAGAAAGLLAASALAAVPGTAVAAQPAPAAAPAPADGHAPAPGDGRAALGSARLANGDRLELIPGKATPGFRVLPAAGERPGSYAYTRTGDRLTVQPVDEQRPQAATTVRTGTATTSTAAPRAATATYPVRIQLANAHHFGPIIRVWNRSTWMSYEVNEEQWDSYGTVSLPPGDYVTAGLYSNWQQPSHLLMRTFRVVDRGLTVTLDAATSKETYLSTDEPTARRYSASVSLHTPKGDVIGYVGGWGEKVYVSPGTVPGVSLTVHDVLTRRDDTPNNPSPYRYHLFHRFRDTIPTAPTRLIRTADLAHADTTLRAAGAGDTGWLWNYFAEQSSGTVAAPVRLPSTVREYVMPGMTQGRLLSYDAGGQLTLPNRTLPAGASPAETFGAAPFTLKPFHSPGIVRQGNRLSVYEPYTLSDAAGNPGSGTAGLSHVHDYRLTGTMATAEAKNLDTAVWSTDLPTARGSYTLTHTVRSARRADQLSTAQTIERTFTSDGYLTGRVPVESVDVRLAVDGLDAYNTAGTAPLTVTAVAGSDNESATATLTGLEYSTDDGATWTALPVPGTGDRASAELTVAQDVRYVALRASAKSSDGPTVRHTTKQAFAGPAVTSGVSTGATKISDVVVNGGRVIAPPMYDTADENNPTFKVTYTASDPSGIARTGVVLYLGDPLRPTALLRRAWAPTCTKVDATTSNCVADFWLNARSQLGDNAFAGEWKAAVWAHAADGSGYADVNGAATALILRESRVTIKAPTTPVTAGSLFTVTGIAGIADWSTGRWLALPGKAVRLEYRKPGVSAYSLHTTVTSDATGTVRATPKALYDANWRWLMVRTPGVGAAASPNAFVDVR
ncbi:hypothetical protein [Streptomyces coeruleoprunus]|uniref:hypothetical protein n=1 Tax=Streptomyces coeruleoprunus TaxID=285563 RepID=UPI0035EC8C06